MTEIRPRGGIRPYLVPTALTLLLLAGFTADQVFLRVPAAEAAPYHLLVQNAATRVPLHIGSWLGTDVPVPPGAVKLLKPNVIVSRRFEDMKTGQRFDFLLVQCTDARDILGHYPPVCYVTHGWSQLSAEPRDWEVDGLVIPGRSYIFSTDRDGLPQRMTIYNFILLPDGKICRGMDEADLAAQDLRRKFLGAAQIQLVFGSDLDAKRRDEMLEMIVRSNRELIDSIRRGLDEHEKQ